MLAEKQLVLFHQGPGYLFLYCEKRISESGAQIYHPPGIVHATDPSTLILTRGQSDVHLYCAQKDRLVLAVALSSCSTDVHSPSFGR